MSYKRAWYLINTMNVYVKGGNTRGGAQLTTTGRLDPFGQYIDPTVGRCRLGELDAKQADWIRSYWKRVLAPE